MILSIGKDICLSMDSPGEPGGCILITVWLSKNNPPSAFDISGFREASIG
jgi:hypothetical protein